MKIIFQNSQISYAFKLTCSKQILLAYFDFQISNSISKFSHGSHGVHNYFTYLIVIFRRYSQRCAGCDGKLEKEDLVRRARDKVFHIRCFQCSVCQRLLDTGDQVSQAKPLLYIRLIVLLILYINPGWYLNWTKVSNKFYII